MESKTLKLQSGELLQQSESESLKTESVPDLKQFK